MNADKRLTQRETAFCMLYAQTRNGREAAARAGYRRPEHMAQKLMRRAEICAQIVQLQRARETEGEVEAGYRRLAFGSVTDAVKLLFLDGVPEDGMLEQLDLFCVSDIKRPKGGGMEIHFFDRIKALEHLAQIQAYTGEDVPLYRALERGARALSHEEET